MRELEVKEYMLSSLIKKKQGSIVFGKMVNFINDRIYVECGLKTIGLVKLNDLKTFKIKYIRNSFIPIFLVFVDCEFGLTISLKKAFLIFSFRRIYSSFRRNKLIKGIVTKKVKGGFIVYSDGLKCFLPSSTLGYGFRSGINIGKLSSFSVIKINKLDKNITLSHKNMVERILQKRKRLFFIDRKVGDFVTGYINNITTYGIFIDLGGVNGLLHLNDLSFIGGLGSLRYLKIGQKLVTKISKIDKKTTRVSLSLKYLYTNPWNLSINDDYFGNYVGARVLNIFPYFLYLKSIDNHDIFINKWNLSWVKVFNVLEFLKKRLSYLYFKVINTVNDKRLLTGSCISLIVNPWKLFSLFYKHGDYVIGRFQFIDRYYAVFKLPFSVYGLFKVNAVLFTAPSLLKITIKFIDLINRIIILG